MCLTWQRNSELITWCLSLTEEWRTDHPSSVRSAKSCLFLLHVCFACFADHVSGFRYRVMYTSHSLWEFPIACELELLSTVLPNLMPRSSAVSLSGSSEAFPPHNRTPLVDKPQWELSASRLNERAELSPASDLWTVLAMQIKLHTTRGPVAIRWHPG